MTKTTALALFACALSCAATAAAQDDGTGAPLPEPPPAASLPSAQPSATATAAMSAQASRETQCADQVDQDGDGMIDCADADCFDDPACVAGGAPERNDERCSDWVDNDGDGMVDCEDQDCSGPGITVCEGSIRGHGGPGDHGGGEAGDDLPELTGDMTVEDLIGNYGDIDGERNDYVCSDGIDNDGDGRTDCQDFGCRFDPQVTVCAGRPSFRFSVVAGVGASLDLQEYLQDDRPDVLNADVGFSRLQLRVLGPIPLIEDSFFLLSMRVERSPRVTFALFQVPLGGGHTLNLNSGGGGLSSGLIVSAAKQPLLTAPEYMLRPFEQGNGAAAEVEGPLLSSGLLRYRVFAAGGSGESNGSVGGRFFRSDDRNFAYSVGAQLGINAIGTFSRFDSPFLYTPMGTTLAFLVGGKYDQRPRERYPALNALAVFGYQRFLLRGETYAKYELDYEAWQLGWNAQTSILLVNQKLFFAADIGMFTSQALTCDPTDAGCLAAGTPDYDPALRRPLDVFEWRLAMHWYWYRNIGVLSLVYRQTDTEQNPDRPTDRQLERELTLEAQYRF